MMAFGGLRGTRCHQYRHGSIPVEVDTIYRKLCDTGISTGHIGKTPWVGEIDKDDTPNLVYRRYTDPFPGCCFRCYFKLLGSRIVSNLLGNLKASIGEVNDHLWGRL